VKGTEGWDDIPRWKKVLRRGRENSKGMSLKINTTLSMLFQRSICHHQSVTFSQSIFGITREIEVAGNKKMSYQLNFIPSQELTIPSTLFLKVYYTFYAAF